jgi:hypothetical protein
MVNVQLSRDTVRLTVHYAYSNHILLRKDDTPDSRTLSHETLTCCCSHVCIRMRLTAMLCSPTSLSHMTNKKCTRQTTGAGYDTWHVYVRYPRSRKWRDAGNDCIIRSFMTCTIHQIFISVIKSRRIRWEVHAARKRRWEIHTKFW